MPKPFQRSERISDLLKQTLSVFIQRELKTSTVGWSTISHIIVSKDLAHAKIFMTFLDERPEKVEKALAYLNHHAPMMRKYLAKTINLRVTPALIFFFDKSAAKANQLDTLIGKLDISDE